MNHIFKDLDWQDWGAAGGKPDGWVLRRSPCCGHTHGVRRTKAQVLRDVLLCLFHIRPHPHRETP